MAIELYWGSGSPFAWRVMLTLEVKRLTYESKLLEFSKGEHKTPPIFSSIPAAKCRRSRTANLSSTNPSRSWPILIASIPIRRCSAKPLRKRA